VSTGATPKFLDATQDVKDFGARGNGQNDDTAAIRRLFIVSRDRRTVFFRRHIPKPTSTLIVPKKINLKERACVVNVSFSGAAMLCACSAFKIHDLRTGMSDMGLLLTTSTAMASRCKRRPAVLTKFYLEGFVPNSSTRVCRRRNIANQFTGLTNITRTIQIRI